MTFARILPECWRQRAVRLLRRLWVSCSDEDGAEIEALLRFLGERV